jgi:hypothetical protein
MDALSGMRDILAEVPDENGLGLVKAILSSAWIVPHQVCNLLGK